MILDEKYMWRCLQLAFKGKGHVSPNPMVGAVAVWEDKIIGEGYHIAYGQPHAEVNAVNAVKDKSLLSESTLYVSLEPCSHYGKTPPCTELIIKHHIPRVVVACTDPFHAVSGRGIKILREAGVDVTVGVLEQEAKELNKEFFAAQITDSPFVYLKWAQSSDGYIDKERLSVSDAPAKLSNDFTQICVHKLRTQADAIMVGTNTAIKDNPRLTSRLWNGKNPIRIVLDRKGRVPRTAHLFDNEVETIVFTETVSKEVKQGLVCFIPMQYDKDLLQNILRYLHQLKIRSVMIEGGSQLLQSVIDQHLWNEAFIEIANFELKKGVRSPNISGNIVDKSVWFDTLQIHMKV